MAQRLFDDMRYIQPEAWIDWQYMEEANDQWCTIRGSFADQTYNKVKNYYVRQQCSRFIKRGYDIITSLCPQSLAAVNAQRDTLVLVALNEGAAGAHIIDLSLFSQLPVRSAIRAYRTSPTENLSNVSSSIKIEGNIITLAMPAQSITTLVIPVCPAKAEGDELFVDGCEYLIVPRQETTRSVTATGSKVTLEDINYGDAQRWRLTREANGTYSFQNALGLKLTAHRASNSSSLMAQKATTSEQGFYIDEVDAPYFKILASRGRSHGLDLSNASSNAGTTVGIWQYNESSNTTPTHRQWMLFPVTAPQQPDAIDHPSLSLEEEEGKAIKNGCVYDLQGRPVSSFSQPLPKGVYIIQGKKVVVK